MRQGGIRLGRIFGIEVSADLGVLLIGGLLTWSLAATILPMGEPGLSSGAYWSVALIGALLFLGSLLAHELSHSVVAQRNGIEVEGITLWLFGGVAQFKNEATNAGAEFRIAAAGPGMSFLLAAAFLGSAYGLDAVGAPGIYVVLLWWLGVINGLLAVARHTDDLDLGIGLEDFHQEAPGEERVFGNQHPKRPPLGCRPRPFDFHGTHNNCLMVAIRLPWSKAPLVM